MKRFLALGAATVGQAVVHALLCAPLARLALLAALVVLAFPARAERIKDLTTMQGVRQNQLVGYGLVVGLDGTGDQTTQTPFTVQSLTTMLSQLGVNIPPGTSLQLKNVAAVMVTALLPAFARPGQPLDITVSSLGNAKSLRGGTLLMTPLKGADGAVYALAQGNLVVGGAGAAAAGSKVQINHLNAGRIPAGGTVERSVGSPFAAGGPVLLELTSADFGTAQRIVRAIDARFGAGTARAHDARSIEVRAPQGAESRVAFVAELEELTIEATLAAAKVVVNARTGSVVMNRAVTLEPAAVAHGNLSVVIATEPVISQPTPFSNTGRTVVAERSDITVKQGEGKVILLEGGAKLADVVSALNAIGVTPQDLLAILQALKAAGALRAEIEII